MAPEKASDADVFDNNEPELIPVRMLNEFTYCPRLCYLEWIQGEFVDSADTIDGRFKHRNVDIEQGKIPAFDDQNEKDIEKIHATSVYLSAQKYGIIGKIDLIEEKDNEVIPVDYKRGKMPDIPYNAWDSDRVQSCAQGLLLRENGYKSSYGEIYYIESKKRVKIDFDFLLINKTKLIIKQIKDLSQQKQIPSPLLDSNKCIGCSLAGICLPDEVNFLKGKIAKPDDVRRLHPLRQDALPVYITDPYGQISKKEDVLIFKVKGKYINSAKLIDVSQLCICGNAQITTQALKELIINEIPICWFTSGTWFIGITSGLGNKNIELRIQQYKTADDKNKSIEFARQIVSAKIRNSRTILRRNHPSPPKQALNELTRLAKSALNKRKLDSLLGVEGAAAKVYFANFTPLIKKSPDNELNFDFKSRNRRPPKDPINATLSFLYAILLKDIHVALISVGLDPFLGFLHQPKYGKPALALDLMEEFRAIIADSVAFSAINNGELKIDNFTIRGTTCSLNKEGRKTILCAYERRIDSTVKHPLFGYAISYRRILEVQARLLARTITGEVNQYKPFTTR